jgi:hypothetical protein
VALPIAACVVLGGGLTAAASSTFTQHLNGGQSLGVGCSGRSLTWSTTDATDGTATCVPSPTTTTPTNTATTTATTTPTTSATPPPTPGCVFASSPNATPAFCDTFDEAPSNPSNSREGALDSTVWGASRWTGNQNYGFSANDWASAQLSTCGSTALVSPPNDIQICNGHLVDTVNDGGTVTSLAMYPKQPFDFAGRTGTIVFDVSNNSQGSHAAWPELWMSDQPVPDPFTHEGAGGLPQNGFGIRFAGCTPGGSCSGTAGVDSAVVVTNHVANDSFFGGNLVVSDLAHVKESLPGQMNHYEVRVSQSQIDVYGTNAFSGLLNLAVTPLVHLATISNANLNFSRGLVWLEDVHYNGDKFNTQRLNTFLWSNFGFDGPVLPRDLAFDVPDNNVPDLSTQAGPSVVATDTGYYVARGASRTLTVAGVTGIAKAAGALLTFDYMPSKQPATLTVAVNGYSITVPATSDSLAVPVPLSEITTGNNLVTFTTTASYAINVMNVDLVLQGAGGVVPP